MVLVTIGNVKGGRLQLKCGAFEKLEGTVNIGSVDKENRIIFGKKETEIWEILKGEQQRESMKKHTWIVDGERKEIEFNVKIEGEKAAGKYMLECNERLEIERNRVTFEKKRKAKAQKENEKKKKKC